MTIRLPNSDTVKRHRSAPNTPVGRGPKPRHLRPFLPLSLEQCCSGHCSGQPGPFVGQQPAISGPSRAAIGPPLGAPMDIRAVSEILGCSPWTVRQTLIPRGLPHFRFKASGRLTFFEGQVIRWIESQQEGGQTTK